ncbi:MAG: hypothetical protein IJN84_06195 [Clostridia bacterium]|nr:hypothetical protein [Clostridia bacterium]
MEELKTKVKYYLRKLTERPIICFCVAIAIYFLQLFLLKVIPFRFISTIIALLMQFSTLALCSKAVVFAADACSLRTMIALFMIFFILVVVVLISSAGLVVMRLLGA